MRVAGRAVGGDCPLFLIAGPCVIEDRDTTFRIADALAELAHRHDMAVVFKASYDKANRTSGESYRGPGAAEGLRILDDVRARTGLPILTDVHSASEVPVASAVVDILQTPAFLVRQTDLIAAVAASGRPVNIKKGQFQAPGDMAAVVAKARAAAAAAGFDQDRFFVCERGASFGYNNLVSDMRALAILARTGCPVVFDATHSVQLPGGQGDRSGGESEFVPLLARAAVAAGVAGLFVETHPEPSRALSDGPNALPLDQLDGLVTTLRRIDEVVKAR